MGTNQDRTGVTLTLGFFKRLITRDDEEAPVEVYQRQGPGLRGRGGPVGTVAEIRINTVSAS